MLIQKTGAVGMDVKIQQFQAKVYKALCNKWGLAENNEVFNAYERCYQNQIKDGYIAEVFTGVNEYKEVFFDDDLTAISFFGLSGNVKHELNEAAIIHLVFFVNLKKLKPSITHRADEEVRVDVMNACGTDFFGFEYLGMDLRVENVLKEYPGSRREVGLKYVDMHPKHCFRLNFSLSYNNNNCSQLKLK
jgi:hypothetical protein